MPQVDEMQELEEEEQSQKNELVGEIRDEKSIRNGMVWSEEDEISLLSGYYEYHHEYLGRKQHCDGAGGFYEFINPRLSLCCCVKQSQVSDKICGLKKKFMDHHDQHASSSSKLDDPHLQKLFQLSAKIWSCRSEEEDEILNVSSSSAAEEEEEVRIKNFDLSNHFLSQEFLDFLYDEGVDVQLLDTQTVTNLKRKYGQLELSRTKFEYKQAKLNIKLQHLKYHHYKTAFHNFCD